MRISDGSSDVCSSDLFERKRGACCFQRRSGRAGHGKREPALSELTHYSRPALKAAPAAIGPMATSSSEAAPKNLSGAPLSLVSMPAPKISNGTANGSASKPASAPLLLRPAVNARSDEHTSELQYLMRNTYAVFC